MSRLRKSGIDVLGEIPWGAHICNFYETKQDLLDILVPYFKAGLENNEFCLLVLSDPADKLTTEEARNALQSGIPGLDRYLAVGQLELVTHENWFLTSGVYDLAGVIARFVEMLNRALAKGFDGMRVNGGSAWLLGKEKELNRFEKQLGDLITGQRLIAVCNFPLHVTNGEDVFDIAHVHRFAIARRKGEWQVIEAGIEMEAIAEIKKLDQKLKRHWIQTNRHGEILSYLIAFFSVVIALALANLLKTHLITAPVPLFICALMFSTWYGGLKPGLFALALSLLVFTLYFLDPFYILVIDIRHLPRLILFALSSLFVVLLSADLGRTADSLRHARDILQGTVQKLKYTNSALQEEIAERRQVEDALRRSEDRTRLIIDTIPIMAWSMTPNGALDFANRRWLDYSGLSLEEEIEDPTQIIHPEDLHGAVEKWNVNMVTGEHYEHELRLRRADGEYRRFLVRTAPLHNEQGEIVKWYGASIDIEESKRVEDALQQSYEETRQLTGYLQGVREKERISIAREIHDELGQQLTAIKMNVAWIDKNTPAEVTDIKGKLKNIITMLDGSNQSIRRILSELRPRILDDQDLPEAIEWLGHQFTETTGIPVKFITAVKDIPFREQIATCIFRVCQEALTNITRYAQAKNVSVSISVVEENIILTIEDDGAGFDMASIQVKKSFGILGMRERVFALDGKFQLFSAPGKGTQIFVSLPLHAPIK